MEEITIRPSLKLIRLGYWVTGLVVAGSVAGYYAAGWSGQIPLWVAFLPGVLWLWPLRRHISRQCTRLAVSGGRLRLESGVFSRSTRLLPLSKVQDVRVEQTFWQRLLDTGDLFVETAGEAGQLSMSGVDAPHRVSKEILRAASGGPAVEGPQEM